MATTWTNLIDPRSPARPVLSATGHTHAEAMAWAQKVADEWGSTVLLDFGYGDARITFCEFTPA